MENHNVQWVNSLFQWPFSIAFCKRLPGRVHLEPETEAEQQNQWFTIAQPRPEQKQSAYDLPSLSAGGRAWLVD